MTKWLPSLNTLRAFEVVSRHLNYRMASEELNVTPAAVKQLVRKLEDSLGSCLLERQGRGLVLTKRGQLAAAGLRVGFNHIADAVETARFHNKSQLVVTSDPSFASLWLVPRLDKYRLEFPEINVLVDSSPQIVNLSTGAADIAIRFGTREDASLNTHRLFNEQLCAYCSPSFLERGSTLKRVEDLENVPLLRWQLADYQWARETAKWNRWQYWLDAVGAGHVRPGLGLSFNDYNLAIQSAIAGHGVVLGSKPILKDLVEAKLLVSPLDEVAITDIGYDLVMTARAQTESVVMAFKDWLINEAESSK